MEDIRHRFFLIIDRFSNGNLSEFSTTSGIPYRTLVDIKDRNFPSLKTLKQLADCEDIKINYNWLLTGEGDMLRANDTEKTTSQNGVEIPIYNECPAKGRNIDFLGKISTDNSDVLFFYQFQGISKLNNIVKNDILGVSKIDDLAQSDLRDIYVLKLKNEKFEMVTLLKNDKKSDTLLSISPDSKSDQKILRSKIEYIYRVIKCMKSF